MKLQRRYLNHHRLLRVLRTTRGEVTALRDRLDPRHYAFAPRRRHCFIPATRTPQVVGSRSTLFTVCGVAHPDRIDPTLVWWRRPPLHRLSRHYLRTPLRLSAHRACFTTLPPTADRRSALTLLQRKCARHSTLFNYLRNRNRLPLTALFGCYQPANVHGLR